MSVCVSKTGRLCTPAAAAPGLAGKREGSGENLQRMLADAGWGPPGSFQRAHVPGGIFTIKL